MDIIIAALTPGSLFNPKEKVWRSMKALMGFTDLSHGDILGILHGDLASQVLVKPGNTSGLLIALATNAMAGELAAGPSAALDSEPGMTEESPIDAPSDLEPEASDGLTAAEVLAADTLDE